MIVSHPHNVKDLSRPAFIYFALTGENSLNLDPYNQPVQFLQSYPINIYSWSLPGHGPELDEREAMKFWYEMWKKGNDPITPFLHESIMNIDHLISLGEFDPQKIAIGGLSRGGYASLRLAAIDDRLKTIVGYAPLTSPSRLDEFGGESYAPLENEVDQLVQKNIWLSIGNADTRVGTELAFQFVHKLALKNIEMGVRSPQVELHVKPSIGYRGHGTSPETFKQGIEWLVKQFKLERVS